MGLVFLARYCQCSRGCQRDDREESDLGKATAKFRDLRDHTPASKQREPAFGA